MRRNGFTLIELSIVLVIIGLIVGGVLVGRNLISAAAVRAQVSQIEKYNQAVNTFVGKYGYLPGDIPAGPAAQIGLVPRGPDPGEGDGNGLLQTPADCAGSGVSGAMMVEGEQSVFWVDLSQTHLIAESLSSASETDSTQGYSTGNINLIFPPAKIGNENYVHVYSGGVAGACYDMRDGKNYFAITVPTLINGTSMISHPGLTVAQASAMDKKVDDGFPQTGNVFAAYYSFLAPGMNWAAGSGSGTGAYDQSATPASTTTCYDNGNTANTVQKYSMTVDNGAHVNCALIFRF